MNLRPSARTRRLFLFLLISLSVCALLNPGDFGTVDTTRRLQVARWIRLGEPPVKNEDRGFGIIGRDGVRHAWYGIGQSLVLLPIDAVVSAAMLPVLVHAGLDSIKQQQVVELLIAFLMQSLITVGSLALAYEVLTSFEFSSEASMAGALVLLFGTTYLQYVQSAQENNLLLLLALCALFAIRRWQHGSGPAWAAIAGATCGFAILVRLPSVLETGMFLGFAVSAGGDRRQFLAGYLPPLSIALLFDRWYHWRRFGEFFGTYMGILGRQLRPHTAPATFPFSYPFWKGFLGTLFDHNKSIFLFDPLLVVLLIVVVWRWRHLREPVRLAILWLGVLLLAYTALYAKYFDFGGDAAWGHRFVTLPVQLLSLFAVPLLAESGKALPLLLRRAAWVAVFGAIVLQALSTTVSPNLEIVQRRMGYHNGVIAARVVNLAQIALHRDSPRFARVPIAWRTPNYLPFQMRSRFPRLASWAIAGWLALLAGLPVLVLAAWRNSKV